VSEDCELCRRCGVDMTPRETRLGNGYCYVCAPLYCNDASIRRSPNEAIEDMCPEEFV
jgi:hypothetical protein